MKKPNIVYILADDMGYGDVSCLNKDSKIHTAHIDRMAGEGIVFTDAHATSAVCTPSRYSILTGRYNWRSNLKKDVLYGTEKALIEQGRMTVASLLKEQGYRTACIGKWHLGWNWPTDDKGNIDFTKPIEAGPISNGFDYFFGIVGSLDMPPYVFIENDTPTAVPDSIYPAARGKVTVREGLKAPDFTHEQVLPVFTEKALGFIDKSVQEDKPFFLYLPLNAPHTPILPTEQFRGKSGTNAYGDFCLQVDDVVGQVMKALDRHGIAEDTILVFTSDNGCSPLADFEELADCKHNPSYVFRGHKADIYEGGHRIPYIIRWPARIKAETMSDEVVCLADLLATAAEITGQHLPDNAGEDSISNLAVWTGKKYAAPLREATVHHSFDGSFSIRRGKWKLEMCPGSGGWSYPRPGKECEGLPPIQLYDLTGDISERENVYDKHPEVVKELTNILTGYVTNGRSTPGKKQSNTGAKYWPQLNWLLESDM